MSSWEVFAGTWRGRRDKSQLWCVAATNEVEALAQVARNLGYRVEEVRPTVTVDAEDASLVADYILNLPAVVVERYNAARRISGKIREALR